jgi:hypothetical protein
MNGGRGESRSAVTLLYTYRQIEHLLRVSVTFLRLALVELTDRA